MIRRPPRSTLSSSSAASDVYKRQAAGEGDATISLTAKAEWDLAAAAVIMDEAGGITTDQRGNPHPYNREDPRFPSLVASGKSLHKLLIERTGRIDL